MTTSRWLPLGVTLVAAVVCGSALAVQLHSVLLVSKGGTGSGRVTSVPPGIDCGTQCAGLFPDIEEIGAGGGPVTLRAVPAAGSVFAGWAGACEGTVPTCTIELIGSTSVLATFEGGGEADTSAPAVRALASRGRRGKPAQLRYVVRDDSGKSTESVAVYRRGKVIARLKRPLGPAEAGKALYYFVTWRVPPKLSGGLLRFCVRATDAAGNRSKTSCASLKIT